MEKLGDLPWFWIILAGVFGAIFTMTGIDYLKAHLDEKNDEAVLNKKEQLVKNFVDWNLPPFSNKALGWNLLKVGLILSFATLVAVITKFTAS